MKIAITAAVVAVCGLLAAGVLGVATAETTPSTVGTPPVRTVSVQGVAIEPLASQASAAVATGVYRQAMAEAVADGHAKALFLAEKGGATLGVIQSMAEGGGYIECPGGVEYEGGQPDFGYATGNGITAAQSTAIAGKRPAPFAGKRRRTMPKAKAKKAMTGTCTLDAQVTLVYQLS